MQKNHATPRMYRPSTAGRHRSAITIASDLCRACCHKRETSRHCRNILVFLASAVVSISCANAGSFGRTDTDNDGWISRTEAAQAGQIAAVFDYADSDGDGRLTSAEFDTAQEVLKTTRQSPQEGPVLSSGGHSGGGHQH